MSEADTAVNKELSSTQMVRKAINVAWPAVCESFFVALANLIDTMMVSTMGSYAVAAVGLTNQPKFIGFSFFFSLNVAVSALIARRKGEGRRQNANEVLITVLTMTLVMCAVISTVFVAAASPIIQIAGSNADTHDAAVIYFRIIMGGMIFNMITMAINSAQRGSGNTKLAMTTNLTSSVVNICCNYVLIGGHFGFPALGVAGAAIATVLGTVVACIMSVRSLFKKTSYVSLPMIVKEKIRPTFQAMKSIVNLSGVFLAENLAMRVGFVATALIAARLGTDAFAAHNVGMNFMTLGFSFADGMQAAAVALSGEALGAGLKEQAKKYGSICQKIGLAISICLAMLMLFGGRWLFTFYFSEDSILDMGSLITKFIMIIVPLQISQVIFGGCLRAAGDVKYTLVASLVSVTLIRTVVTILMTTVLHLGLVGIWLGIFGDQASRFIFMWLRFRAGKWVHLKI